MKVTSSQIRSVSLDFGLRVCLGIIFLIAGITKLPMHPEWVEVVMAYEILPPSLAEPYALALPWLEIIIGSCLILGLFTRVFSIISILVIASFIVGNAFAISGNINDECGCFGELIMVNHKWALVIDALLLIGASVIFSQRRRFMALGSLLNSLSGFNRQYFL